MKNLRAGCVLVAALSYLSLCQSQRAPVITYIADDQEVNVGGTVEMGCSVQYAGTDYPVIWAKRNDEGLVYISTGTSLVLKESRFALLYDGASATYIVLIKDVQSSDAGEYQCEVVLSTNNKLTAITRLSVLQPPVITDNTTTAIVTTEGESVQMECFAHGNPMPNIIWRRENNALLPTGGNTYNGNILKIHSVHKEDRGTYYCFADNGVGKGDRRNINLEIEFSPVITTPRKRVGQALNHDQDLECHVEAYPPPQIRWTKDSNILSNTRNYKISNFNTADEFTDSTLRVSGIKSHQFGEYICTAVNKLGQDEASVELYEQNYPACPPSCGKISAATSHKLQQNFHLFIFISFIYTILHLR
ncbi:hypothetical protein PVAND_008910 [Polypedilum vanderplanki]|uniref:Ig-like domain-containing protein n=1 Tax=Polypedilum vanderplanki TaxID=319348 RepID=A0A9J6CB98_POLVA|nr:hypothetical protein PVAND_008910 [Polypedilum vanderplanki]